MSNAAAYWENQQDSDHQANVEALERMNSYRSRRYIDTLELRNLNKLLRERHLLADAYELTDDPKLILESIDRVNDLIKKLLGL